jgi:transcriptional/translational regulatory protein YebC/TACO1
MSGHSKWATIKHKKGALDAKRGKIFTRLIKEITMAAKGGGGDPDTNPRLRGAIAAAKAENMPADNIKIRHTFTKGGGNLGEAGSVAWMFHKKGSILVPKAKAKEDDLMNIVLENGGEDLHDDGENWEVTTDPGAYETVLEAVKKAGIEVVHSEVGMVPQNYIKLEGAAANQMIRLLEAIEDQDDVQNVFSNFDVDQKTLEEVAG